MRLALYTAILAVLFTLLSLPQIISETKTKNAEISYLPPVKTETAESAEGIATAESTEFAEASNDSPAKSNENDESEEPSFLF